MRTIEDIKEQLHNLELTLKTAHISEVTELEAQIAILYWVLEFDV